MCVRECEAAVREEESEGGREGVRCVGLGVGVGVGVVVCVCGCCSF